MAVRSIVNDQQVASPAAGGASAVESVNSDTPSSSPDGRDSSSRGGSQGRETSATTATTPDASQDTEQQPQKVRRKPVPGKGFRKSRTGCFNCKRRRVKCCETRPGCQSCRRMRLDCVYPAATALPKLRNAAAAVLMVSPCKPVVNLDHLRFFRHFLVEAYPPHPYGVSTVWQDVAALSHSYDFLAHALLALAAQHLTLFTPCDYSVQALDLRVSALQGLNAAFSRPCVTAEDGDARCAAAIALTWQSSYMSAPGSLREFLVTMRGWMVVATTMTPDPDNSLFRDFTREAFVGSLRHHVGGEAVAMAGTAWDADRADVIDGFLASLEVLRPLCGSLTERRYLSALEKLGCLVRTSPLDALLQMAPCWALTNKMTEDEFADFTEPSNHAAQVLLAHFLMLDRALEMHFLDATGSSQSTFCKKVSKVWIVNMASSLPAGYEKYMMWPLGLATGRV
ncbi:hypothetical protein JDV02_003372 [Purpureocillium takamizusanense]|uniref:Zn(2)-C6 fungal-type domain-containing protein n=1 Tax=Purpureocillium takamizusanense TaxID=2060973 RepID=A0A9Q8QCA5_9HYPO|nr:uncharacterized protein JDV02_003372 [Purpureocillium takamizusanense]UNI16990.1 hypothetical protein JDV02_003372 [Purpureocillium takamizusanense]